MEAVDARVSVVMLEPVDSVLALSGGAAATGENERAGERARDDFGMTLDGGTELKDVVVTMDVVLAELSARLLPVL